LPIGGVSTSDDNGFNGDNSRNHLTSNKVSDSFLKPFPASLLAKTGPSLPILK
jgi:hypothetical protein